MESPEKLRQRLQSLDDLKDVVKTMKSLSAANIRQYELAVTSLQEYYRTVELGLQVVVRDVPDSGPEPVPAPRRGAVIFGSDHGLCGHFNENLADYVLHEMHGNNASTTGQKDLFLFVGTRALDYFERADKGFFDIDDAISLPGTAAGITLTVQQILLRIEHWRSSLAIGHVELFHNRLSPEGLLAQTRVGLLPVDIRNFRNYGDKPWPSHVLPTYSMDWQTLFGALLRQYFFVRLFRACAESQEAEHSIRLRAMQEAEKNIDDNHEALTADYRRARQSAITSELLDIVSGYRATASPDKAEWDI